MVKGGVLVDGLAESVGVGDGCVGGQPVPDGSLAKISGEMISIQVILFFPYPPVFMGI